MENEWSERWIASVEIALVRLAGLGELMYWALAHALERPKHLENETRSGREE